MKPLHPLEKIALTLSLAVVAAMMTQCQPAHAQPIKTSISIGKNGYTASGAFAYPSFAHPHDEFGFAANNNLAQMPRSNAALFCVSFSTSVMVQLDDVEAFAPASFLDYLSANHVIRLNRLHFAVNDSTSINNLGVINHAV